MERQAFRLEEPAARRQGPIVGDICLPTSCVGPVPVVALSHALGEHRGIGILPEIQESLAAAGIAAVAFHVSRSGVGDDGAKSGDDGPSAGQEPLGPSTFAHDVDDLERVVTAIFERLVPGRERFEIYRIGIAGIDLGGAVAIVEAARDSRVKVLATIGAPARVEFGVPDGAPPVDATSVARDLAIPFLVLHAEEDERTPLAQARGLFFAGNERAEMEVLAGARHDLAPPARARAIASLVAFFKKHL